MLEQIIEKLIEDDVITRQEIEQSIEEERKKNPIGQDVQNLGEFVLMTLNNDDNLSLMVMSLLARVQALEVKVNA